MNLQHDNPKAYDAIYAGSPQVKKEDEEFLRVVGDVIDTEGVIIDLGCGTGLCLHLLGDRLKGYYIGVDLSKEMISECTRRYADRPMATFLQEDCYRYMERAAGSGRTYTNPCVSLYAMDYMNPDIVRLIYNTFTGGCLFILFNEPWKQGSASVWTGEKAEYDRVARANSEAVLNECYKYGFNVTRFCNEDYYYLVTRPKQGV